VHAFLLNRKKSGEDTGKGPNYKSWLGKVVFSLSVQGPGPGRLEGLLGLLLGTFDALAKVLLFFFFSRLVCAMFGFKSPSTTWAALCSCIGVKLNDSDRVGRQIKILLRIVRLEACTVFMRCAARFIWNCLCVSPPFTPRICLTMQNKSSRAEPVNRIG